jgi:hypothetical protein
MSTPTGSEQNYPQGGAPQGGQPGWSAPPPPPAEYNPPGYSPQGYGAAPGYDPAQSYAGGPPPGQRPGTVTAAAVIGIVWGAIGALFGLLLMFAAFALGAALAGLILLVSTALSVALIVAGVQVLQGKSPRLLLLLSYLAIALSVLTLIVALVAEGGSAWTGILGIIIPGAIVFLLMQPQTKQHYASRGISY